MSNVISLVVVAVLFSINLVTANPAGTHFRVVAFGSNKIYSAAPGRCLEAGGWFGKIDSQAKYDQAFQVLNAEPTDARKRAWIGLDDLRHEGEFQYYMDGSFLNATGFSAWCDGQPDNANTTQGFDNCVVMDTGKLCTNGNWLDVACIRVFPNVLCEFNSTFGPTFQPTKLPTPLPTSLSPSMLPTRLPTGMPSQSPTLLPTLEPTLLPTEQPTLLPTSLEPTVLPTSLEPTLLPTAEPTLLPTAEPTLLPTSLEPTLLPTAEPTLLPTVEPTNLPTEMPSLLPTVAPSVAQTFRPSGTVSSTCPIHCAMYCGDPHLMRTDTLCDGSTVDLAVQHCTNNHVGLVFAQAALWTVEVDQNTAALGPLNPSTVSAVIIRDAGGELRFDDAVEWPHDNAFGFVLTNYVDSPQQTSITLTYPGSDVIIHVDRYRWMNGVTPKQVISLNVCSSEIFSGIAVDGCAVEDVLTIDNRLRRRLLTITEHPECADFAQPWKDNCNIDLGNADAGDVSGVVAQVTGDSQSQPNFVVEVSLK